MDEGFQGRPIRTRFVRRNVEKSCAVPSDSRIIDETLIDRRL